jgi:hypothetical protein
MNAFPFLRFDARQPRYWYHQYQHIYMVRRRFTPRLLFGGLLDRFVGQCLSSNAMCQLLLWYWFVSFAPDRCPQWMIFPFLNLGGLPNLLRLATVFV